jgi:hypothetical protein
LKCNRNTKCGKGIKVIFSGDKLCIVIGWFRNGIFSGQGRSILEKNLLHYEGDFINFRPHGKGILSEPDGLEYTGDFKNGKREGFGVCRFGDGSVYTGGWKDGKKHGKATKVY